jgi:hypothetical protein
VKWDNLAVFYYHLVSGIWPYGSGYIREVAFGGSDYKRGGLWWEWLYKRGGLWWEWLYKRGGWDDPSDMPVMVASNSAGESCSIVPKGDNLFAAIK